MTQENFHRHVPQEVGAAVVVVLVVEVVVGTAVVVVVALQGVSWVWLFVVPLNGGATTQAHRLPQLVQHTTHVPRDVDHRQMHVPLHAPGAGVVVVGWVVVLVLTLDGR